MFFFSGEVDMLKKAFFFLFVVIFVYYPVFAGHTVNITPAKGEAFPVIKLSMPEKESERAYLGLSDNELFKLSDIKAELLIIEILSMYCPYCQKEAPIVNDLYRAIEKNPALRDKIKMIGIGAGNTPFEINIFRNQYSVPFPLFDDQSFLVHKKIGEVRTPYFFVLRINADGSNRIIYSRVGTINDAAQFLDFILDEAEIKQKER